MRLGPSCAATTLLLPAAAVAVCGAFAVAFSTDEKSEGRCELADCAPEFVATAEFAPTAAAFEMGARPVMDGPTAIEVTAHAPPKCSCPRFDTLKLHGPFSSVP